MAITEYERAAVENLRTFIPVLDEYNDIDDPLKLNTTTFRPAAQAILGLLDRAYPVEAKPRPANFRALGQDVVDCAARLLVTANGSGREGQTCIETDRQWPLNGAIARWEKAVDGQYSNAIECDVCKGDCAFDLPVKYDYLAKQNV